MKTLNAIIERNEEGFYAYVDQLEGCVAGGLTYAEVKENLEEMIKSLWKKIQPWIQDIRKAII